jgi:Fe-S cluster assembly scaffold protein SufB
MSYLWQEFNIKTFPAETLVFRNGVFYEDLSDYKSAEFNQKENIINILKTSKIPIHIIYIGEITGNIELNINILAKNTKVIMTTKIINKKPAFLNIFVKNTGKNSLFDGQIIAQNYKDLKITAAGQHLCENTGIFVKTRVLAHKNTNTVLTGIAKIDKKQKYCDSDISFSVMADKSAKITMKPTQFIQSVPEKAVHSASLYKPYDNQINYLRSAGLSGVEVKSILEEAFLSEQ